MSKYHNDKTAASDPIAIRLSEDKLRRLQPELYGWRSFFTSMSWNGRKLGARQIREMIAEHLRSGDSRAAIVVQTGPQLLVAAYTDEQDAVLLLRYPEHLVVEHNLSKGSRLLTVNTYGRGKTLAADIVLGPASLGRWTNFYPMVAEFLSDDLTAIERRKGIITETEWKRAAMFGTARLSSPGCTARDGRPLKSGRPGKPLGPVG
jgi:hypothetical protein